LAALSRSIAAAAAAVRRRSGDLSEPRSRGRGVGICPNRAAAVAASGFVRTAQPQSRHRDLSEPRGRGPGPGVLSERRHRSAEASFVRTRAVAGRQVFETEGGKVASKEIRIRNESRGAAALARSPE
jgi:hypothetical protein